MITQTQFESAFFYIGAGFDVEPIRRMSHVCQDFLYLNLYLDKEEVESWYKEWLKRVGFEIISVTCDDTFLEETHLETYPGFRRDILAADFMTRYEKEQYNRAFIPALNDGQFLIHFRLRKRSTGRLVNLYYICAEGLATYMLLSRNGLTAPKVLCTIETKILEHPDSMMNRFYENERHARPQLWIRGFKPSKYWDFRVENNALEPEGVFSDPVLDFNEGWHYAAEWMFGGKYLERRHCKGFTTPETTKQLKALRFQPDYLANEDHLLKQDPLSIDDSRVGPNDLIVVPERLKQQFKHHPGQVLDWTQLGASRWYCNTSAKTQLERLAEYIKGQSISFNTAHLIPACLEDEGQLYYETLTQLPFKTISYVPGVFDMLDMRECLPRKVQAMIV